MNNMKLILTLLLLLPTTVFTALAQDEKIYPVLDEEPQFPGGTAALKRFLVENIVYPQRALEAGITGKCYTQFIVSEDGTITNPIVKRGVPDCPECDAEAIRVIKLMPKWIPGKYSGEADKSVYYLQIPFKME